MNQYGIRFDMGSRFSTVDEIKEQFTKSNVKISKESEDVSGIPILHEFGEVYLDNTTAHSIIFGQTGSGKTRRVVLPTLRSVINAKENALLLDVKGELYNHTCKLAEEKGYDIKVLNIRNPRKGHSYNPLKHAYSLYLSGDKERAEIKLYHFVKSLTHCYKDVKDPYWINAVETLSICLLKIMLDICKTDPMSYNINTLIKLGSEYADFNSDTKCMFDIFVGLLCNDEKFKKKYPYADKVAKQLMSLVNLPNTTRGCVANEFNTLYSKFTFNQYLCDRLSDWSDNTIDISSIVDTSEKPIIIYIITPDENTSFNFIAQFFITELYEALVNKTSEGKSTSFSRRWNFILDEFANGMHIDNILNMMTACRSRNIRMYLVAQDLNQLSSTYSVDMAKSMISNAKNIVYTKTNDYALMDVIKHLCGDTYSVGLGKYIHLLDVCDLASFKMGDVLIKGDGVIYCSHLPDISKYIDDSCDNELDLLTDNKPMFKTINLRNLN